jgi:hypothetical protein
MQKQVTRVVPCDCPADLMMVSTETEYIREKDGTITQIDHTNCKRRGVQRSFLDFTVPLTEETQ